MLEEKRRNLFWTPCAAYCIDRILEDTVKIKWVRECMEKAQKITKFIYNSFWLLSLMKKEFTAGQELLKPSFTRYSSTFTTVQSLLDHRNGLKRMFQSNKWLSSRYSKLEDGKEVEKIVLNATFWRKMQYVRKSVDPILEVLQKINSNESHSIPFIYNNVYQAKLAVKTNHNGDEGKYRNILDIIDSHWNSLSHHPLYLAAHFLNPSYRYRPDFVPVGENSYFGIFFSPTSVIPFSECVCTVASRGCTWTECMHCAIGARQCKKNFCIHASEDSFLFPFG